MTTYKTEKMQSTEPLFGLGKLVISPGVAKKVRRLDLDEALYRHQRGDWGTVCGSDCYANNQALKNGLRIVSAYETAEWPTVWITAPSQVAFWIITEEDRSVTTVLLPDEY